MTLCFLLSIELLFYPVKYQMNSVGVTIICDTVHYTIVIYFPEFSNFQILCNVTNGKEALTVCSDSEMYSTRDIE